MWILIWTCGEQLKNFSRVDRIIFALWKAHSGYYIETGLERGKSRRIKSGEIVAIKVREDSGLDQVDSSGGGDKCINQQDLMFRLRM